MKGFSLLGRNWKDRLGKLISASKTDLLISSPYVSREGVQLLLSSISPSRRPRLGILTNLSPTNISQRSTDPNALKSLRQIAPGMRLFHLPRLHAKVYIADTASAIITSGNLTGSGLLLNYEYGVEICKPVVVASIRRDIEAYAQLGAMITPERLAIYCELAQRLQKAFSKKLKSVTRAVQREFRRAFQATQDELLRSRLAEAPLHGVFARTILYLLERHRVLRTVELHPLIEAIHPDLCDNTVDRVIDGRRFGKKWKHAARTAQQHLKKTGSIELVRGRWMLTQDFRSRLEARNR